MKLCECGCGQPAPIAKANYPSKGHVKGSPVRFVSGHNQRGQSKSPETRARMAAYASQRPAAHHQRLVASAQGRTVKPDALPSTIHSWLGRHHPKRGVCERCGTKGDTDYAFTLHPQPHTRNRCDYLELCRRCHIAFDIATGIRPNWRGIANRARKKRAA